MRVEAGEGVVYKPPMKRLDRPTREIDGVGFPIAIDKMGWYKMERAIHPTMRGKPYKHHFIDINGISVCGKVIRGIDEISKIDDLQEDGDCCAVCLSRVRRKANQVKKALLRGVDKYFENESKNEMEKQSKC